jgi:hypothetical protein
MDAIISSMSEHFIFTIVAVCILAAIIMRSTTTIVTMAARERSRREIAAYVAEGSIKPEDAERLLRADLGRAASCP